MNIEISDQTTQRIREVIGSFGPKTINAILGRVANDEQLLLSLMSDALTDSDIQAIREGMEDVAAGRTEPFSEFDAKLRAELGFLPRLTQ